jgi:hypothetical protein
MACSAVSNEVYVKSLLSGFACACLVWSCCAAAQQQPPPPPAGGAPATPDSQNPTSPDQPPVEPQTGGLLPEKVPELPRIPDVRMPGERGVWLGFSSWFANPRPNMEKGNDPYAYLGNIPLAGDSNYNNSVEGGVALGAHNVLRFAYFTSRGTGAELAPSEVGLYTQVYLQGDYLVTDYRIKSVKLSFDYLSWPYPVKTSRFRLKTLWQFQYMQIRTGFDAPYIPITDSLGNPLLDSSGNPLSYATQGTERFYLPEVGLGVQEWINPHLRLEATGAGFIIPHHQNSWDYEGSANLRISHYEIRVGVRGYHFRTPGDREFWFKGTMNGPFIGIRLYTDQIH